METRVERLRIGDYKLIRPLEPAPLHAPLAAPAGAQRWLAFNEPEQSAHIAYRFKLARMDPMAFRAAAEAGRPLCHPHLLPVETLEIGPAGSAWVFAPFTGNHDGLVTLRSLLEDKGGRITPVEAERAMVQLLGAVEHAHAAGFQHGDVSVDEILVDRRGSLSIELYGLRRRMGGLGGPPASEVIKDEVRSIVQIGYQLVTGLSADEPLIPASRLIPRLERRWDDWFQEGLDPFGGFAGAAAALGALPGSRRESEERDRPGPVQVVIRRVRAVLGQA
jgi:hypothetical protein